MSATAEIATQVQKFFEALKRMRDRYPEASEQLDELESSFVKATVRMSIHMLDSMDFHHMEEHISEGHLDPQYVPVIRNALVVLDAAPWPEKLKSLSTPLRNNLAKLEASLIAKRAEEAKSLSHEIHEEEHELSHEASDGLSAEHHHH